jgi:hypothetical protein
VISPPDATGVEGTVVVVGGAVVVVTEAPPPLSPLPPPVAVVVVTEAPPPPLSPLPPPVAVDVAVVGNVAVEIEETIDQRAKSPENWLLMGSDASVQATFERAEFESLPPIADAEASIFTNATRRQDETASVMTLARRCVVFARKKFLNVPLYMKYKFAVSNHTTTYEISTVPQISLMLPR